MNSDLKQTIIIISSIVFSIFGFNTLKEILKYYGASDQTLIFINSAVVIASILFIRLFCRKK